MREGSKLAGRCAVRCSVISGATDIAMTGLTKALVDAYCPHACKKWRLAGKELSETLIMDEDAQRFYDNNIRVTKLEAKFRTWEDDIIGINDRRK